MKPDRHGIHPLEYLLLGAAYPLTILFAIALTKCIQ